MKGSWFVGFTLALFGMIWSGSTVEAQPRFCRSIFKVVKAGTSFNGQFCNSVTYTPMGSNVPIQTTTCSCQALICITLCIPPGGPCTRVVNAYCHPNFLVKAP